MGRALQALPLSLSLLIAGWGGARSQTVDTTLWVFSPGDRVLAIGRVGHTLYLGGNFRMVGPSTGGGVPYDVHSVKPLPRYPRVVGRVDVAVGDGNGGWFVGGRFTAMGGLPRKNLAHIEADGTVAAWAPNPNERVLALLLNGPTLYVGGAFDSVGGVPRGRVAALSTTSDVPLPMRCDTNEPVTSFAIAGSTLYVGGWFTAIAGRPARFVAAVDASTGAPAAWHVDMDDRVSTLAIHDTTLFIGGYFWTANADTHRCIAAVGTSTGAVHAWNALVDRQPPSTMDFGPHISSILFSGESLFVAGSFTHIGGQARKCLAQLDLQSARATDWNARAFRQTQLGPDFNSMVLAGDTLFVAGSCDSIGGKACGQVSALSSRTAEKFDWDPLTNDFVFALGLQGGVIYVGGWFTSVGDWVVRRGLAAIDEDTGRVTDWDPRPNNSVNSLLVYGGKIYVGGYFDVVGGQTRVFLAALDPVTGQATSWNPGSDGGIWALAPLGSSILAGGPFVNRVGGQFRKGIAAIDTATGQATTWDARADGDVFAIAATDSVVYVGGDLFSMGGQPRTALAALDSRTGDVTPWNPGTDGYVSAITLLDSTIYVGGQFDIVAGVPRRNLAAIDLFGAATDWSPDADFVVEALASDDSTIYAGGFFSTVFGESHEWFAALDPKKPLVRREFPHPDGPVWALHESEGTIYVGGGFGKMGPWPQVCLAAIRPNSALPQPVSPNLMLAQSAPNPASTSAIVRYSLPADLPVKLTIFDLQGRRVRNVVSDVFQSAGPHQVRIPTADLRAGCYLYCLEAGSHRVTRKMVVIK